MKFSHTYQPKLRRSRFMVFVYGSLRKGFGNHVLLQQPSTKFIGRATIRAKLFTQHWGWPFIIFSRSNANRVVGEIYEVDYTTFCRLDGLEGYTRGVYWCLFNRKHAVATSKADMTKMTVWVYEGGRGLQQAQHKTELPSGDWRIAKQEHDCPRATANEEPKDEAEPSVTSYTTTH
jgi:gamma-glutamylaminecyclotransferase